VGNLHNPIRTGWMYKEGHKRKTFKKRFFVVWPRDFKEMNMDAPILFYFDSDTGGEVRDTTICIDTCIWHQPLSR
jgi:hypothetical protein